MSQSRVRMLIGTLLKEDTSSHFNLLVSTEPKHPMTHISSYNEESFKSLLQAINNKLIKKIPMCTQTIFNDVPEQNGLPEKDKSLVENLDPKSKEEAESAAPPPKAESDPVGNDIVESPLSADVVNLDLKEESCAKEDKVYYLVLSYENLKTLMANYNCLFTCDEVIAQLRNKQATYTGDTSNIILKDLKPYQVKLDDGLPLLDVNKFVHLWKNKLKTQKTPANPFGFMKSKVNSMGGKDNDEPVEGVDKKATYVNPPLNMATVYGHASDDPSSRTAQVLLEEGNELPSPPTPRRSP